MTVTTHNCTLYAIEPNCDYYCMVVCVCVCVSIVCRFFPAIFYFAEFAIATFFCDWLSPSFMHFHLHTDHLRSSHRYCRHTCLSRGALKINRRWRQRRRKQYFPLIVKPPFVRARQRSNRTNASYNFTTTKTPNKPIVYGTAYQSHLNAFQTH